MKFYNKNLHNNVVIIFKQLKTVLAVYFSYLEAGDIGYLSFRISEDSELEKWPNYPDLPYLLHIFIDICILFYYKNFVIFVVVLKGFFFLQFRGVVNPIDIDLKNYLIKLGEHNNNADGIKNNESVDKDKEQQVHCERLQKVANGVF